MKIVVLGTGYVGLVHAAVCSEYGHEVIAYDNDVAKLEAFATGQAREIANHVNEPGLDTVIRETIGRYLYFSTDLKAIIEGTDAVFMLSLIHISEPTRLKTRSRMPSSA